MAKGGNPGKAPTVSMEKNKKNAVHNIGGKFRKVMGFGWPLPPIRSQLKGRIEREKERERAFQVEWEMPARIPAIHEDP